MICDTFPLVGRGSSISVALTVTLILGACSKRNESPSERETTATAAAATDSAAAAGADGAAPTAALEAPEADPPDDPSIVMPTSFEPLALGLAPFAHRLAAKAKAKDDGGDGDDDAAFELAEALLREDGIPSDAARAAALYGGLCKTKNLADACARLGDLYLRGFGVPRHVGHAIKLLDDACERGHSAFACARIGGERLWAMNVGFDLERGLRQANKGCDLGEPLGCYVVERAMFVKLVPGEKKARRALVRKAESLRLDACKKKKHYACATIGKSDWIADHVGRRYGGDPPDVDEADAEAQASAALIAPDGGRLPPPNAIVECEGGDFRACLDLPEKWWTTFRKACEGGDYRACGVTYPLGNMDQQCRGGDCGACNVIGRDSSSSASSETPNAKRQALFKAACTLGCLEICRELLEIKDLPPTEKTDLTNLACTQGLARACVTLAEGETDQAQKLRRLKAACPSAPRNISLRDFSAKACKLAGNALRQSSPAEAKELYERACYSAQLGGPDDYEACFFLGELFAKDNPRRALSHYAAGCEKTALGVRGKDSCMMAKTMAQHPSIAPAERAAIVRRANNVLGLPEDAGQ